MNWFLIALIPPALWSVTNHFDKYLLSKYFKGGGVGALMIFSSIIGVFILSFIALIHPEVLNVVPRYALLISLNGFLYILAVLPYFYALQKDEASVAVPLFQMVPVFSYFLAWVVLKETLTINQMFGGLLIILGAVGISLELMDNKQVRFKKDVFFLMALSSLLFSLNFLFFKFFALEAKFWTTSFYEYIGFVAFAFLLLMFVKPYREEFISVMRKNRVAVLTLNGINEVVNIVAKLSFNFASLLTPITLTWIVNGFQPFFVFVYGVILTVFFPHISKEKIDGKHLAQKLIAIIVMFVGAYLLNKNSY
jgi:drug/metabolite transporter (DMT)-like permease